jgi:hypothetical protein
MKQAVGLYEEAQITRKRAKFQKRIPQISVLKPSENRLNSQQLFLNPNLGVKWRGKDSENIDIVMAESTENLLLLFALIDH